MWWSWYVIQNNNSAWQNIPLLFAASASQILKIFDLLKNYLVNQPKAPYGKGM